MKYIVSFEEHRTVLKEEQKEVQCAKLRVLLFDLFRTETTAQLI